MVVNGWYTCPKCRKKLIKIYKDSTIRRTPVWCDRCKEERFPFIVNGTELRER